MNITLISDTHAQHEKVILIGGDVLIHSGDVMTDGYNKNELVKFFDWFDKQDYKHKIFVPGNHDRFIENNPKDTADLLKNYNINMLIDNEIIIDNIKFYGSPYQPWFYNWAFNLPRNGKELEDKWKLIPDDTNVLITHSPAFGYVDTVEYQRDKHLGCELLTERIKSVQPKIHVSGHIHSSHGHQLEGNTNFYNASLLNEQYRLFYKPINIIYDEL